MGDELLQRQVGSMRAIPPADISKPYPSQEFRSLVRAKGKYNNL